MTNRQLLILIGVCTVLALTLAWMIERTQVARFVDEFDKWWEEKNSGSIQPPPSE